MVVASHFLWHESWAWCRLMSCVARLNQTGPQPGSEDFLQRWAGLKQSLWWLWWQTVSYHHYRLSLHFSFLVAYQHPKSSRHWVALLCVLYHPPALIFPLTFPFCEALYCWIQCSETSKLIKTCRNTVRCDQKGLKKKAILFSLTVCIAISVCTPYAWAQRPRAITSDVLKDPLHISSKIKNI